MARRNRDVVFVERESSSPLWWLVMGGALGAGLALLFAPDSGSATRRILARRLAGLKTSAEDLLGEFREAAESVDEEEEVESDDEVEEEDEADEDDEEDERGCEECHGITARRIRVACTVKGRPSIRARR